MDKMSISKTLRMNTLESSNAVNDLSMLYTVLLLSPLPLFTTTWHAVAVARGGGDNLKVAAHQTVRRWRSSARFVRGDDFKKRHRARLCIERKRQKLFRNAGCAGNEAEQVEPLKAMAMTSESEAELAWRFGSFYIQPLRTAVKSNIRFHSSKFKTYF